MSEASINQVLKRIGYDKRAKVRGFRHTMSTILNKEVYNTAWIEVQLAHVDKNIIRVVVHITLHSIWNNVGKCCRGKGTM